MNGSVSRVALLGHLARFESLFGQGELLCTQGLAYILEGYPAAGEVLADVAEARTGVSIGSGLRWRAEAVQEDRGRPDLEASTMTGTPVVKVEAKLDASLQEAQIRSYAADLAGRGERGVLLVVVPARRVTEAGAITANALGLRGPGPWRPSEGTGLGVAVLSWDEVFATLGSRATDRCAYDIEQLEAMYRVLIGDDIEPLAGREDLLRWRSRASDLLNIIDRATRDLTTQLASHKVYPMGLESMGESADGLESVGYRRRYVCPAVRGTPVCFSIGLRDPFAGYETPVWMRFHQETPGFGIVSATLSGSGLPTVYSGGHIWIPLNVPARVSAGEMVGSLVSQAREVYALANAGA